MSLTDEQQDSINKHITEVIFGECWHKTSTYPVYHCDKCGKSIPLNKWNYCTSWDAFGQLLTKVRAKEEFSGIKYQLMEVHSTSLSFLILDEISPATFALACAKRTGWKDAVISNITCPKCGAPEVSANTPRTVYACGSSDYDQRPGTFERTKECPRGTIRKQEG